MAGSEDVKRFIQQWCEKGFNSVGPWDDLVKYITPELGFDLPQEIVNEAARHAAKALRESYRNNSFTWSKIDWKKEANHILDLITFELKFTSENRKEPVRNVKSLPPVTIKKPKINEN